MEFPLAIVEWIDANSDSGEMDQTEMVPLIHARSIGWLVREEKDYVTLAGTLFDRARTYRDITHIPRVNITRLKKSTDR